MDMFSTFTSMFVCEWFYFKTNMIRSPASSGAWTQEEEKVESLGALESGGYPLVNIHSKWKKITILNG